jgi:predicted metal-dependent hydrolase
MDRRTTRTLMRRLNRDAAVIAARFGLRYRSIEAEAARVKRRYGICYSDGTIRIRLRHASTGKPLKYSSLVSTLCHELAHLQHFDHGTGFQSFYAAILEYARDQGIYRPGRRAAAPVSLGDATLEPVVRAPRQLSLF